MTSSQTARKTSGSSVSERLNAIYDVADSTTALDASIDISYAPLVPSLNFSSAHAYADEQSLDTYHKNKHSHHRYGRDSNSLVSQLERIFSNLLDGHALLFSSGMSGIWSVLWSTLGDTDRYVTVGSFYRKTLTNIDSLCAATGKQHDNYGSIDDLLAEDDLGRALLFLESPSNPFLTIIDIKQIRERFPDAIIVYDNTMAGLLNDRRSLSAVDFVISSVTKYIGGHNDVIGGVVSCSDERRMTGVWDVRSAQGGIMDPMAAFLLFRSLKTYDIRMDRILSNVTEVLGYLEQAPAVQQLYYPGSHTNEHQRDTFSQAYVHGGGVITFLIDESIELGGRFRALHSSKMAPSFGATDTLVERPATMSHAGKSAEELDALGLKMNHVRLSVGMEPVDYIIRDLERLAYR